MERLFTITLREVCKSFIVGKKQSEVIKNASMEFKQGRTYALVGVSGSGKSTLLHLIAGIDQPSSGTIVMNGTQTSHLTLADRAQLIGLVFQQSYLFEAFRNNDE